MLRRPCARKPLHDRVRAALHASRFQELLDAVEHRQGLYPRPRPENEGHKAPRRRCPVLRRGPLERDGRGAWVHGKGPRESPPGGLSLIELSASHDGHPHRVELLAELLEGGLLPEHRGVPVHARPERGALLQHGLDKGELPAAAHHLRGGPPARGVGVPARLLGARKEGRVAHAEVERLAAADRVEEHPARGRASAGCRLSDLPDLDQTPQARVAGDVALGPRNRPRDNVGPHKAPPKHRGSEQRVDAVRAAADVEAVDLAGWARELHQVLQPVDVVEAVGHRRDEVPPRDPPVDLVVVVEDRPGQLPRGELVPEVDRGRSVS
mmetsp:Transcript_14658/g.34873  ORF Transcript_14658/g.34873 Transcript_14658/m.34873 type:complete len:324 (-) Transcript_14658:809-1780(-)